MRERHKRETQERQYAGVRFAVSESDAEKGTFRGLASVFGTLIDAYVPTIIHQGAFAKTLQENAHRVRILWQHESWEPIGRPVSMKETALGLEVEGKISDVSRGRDALTLMRDEVITDLSIGFDPIRVEFENREGQDRPIRHIHEARLWEFSLVTWGANEPAKIQAVHALERMTAAELLDLYAERLAALPDGEHRSMLATAIERLSALQSAAEPQAPTTDDGAALTARRELNHRFIDMKFADAFGTAAGG